MRLGGVRARYADSVSASAGAIGLLGSWETASWRAAADVAYSQFSSGGSATQGSVNGAWVRPLGARAAFGLQALGTGNLLSSGLSAWTGTMQAFAAATGAEWLVLGGVSAGAARTIWSQTEGVYGAMGRVRRDAGPVTLEATAAGTWAGSLRFTDLTATADWASPGAAVRLGVAAGTRLGDLSGKPLIQAHGQFTIPGGSGIVVEGALGRYPEDLTGFTSGVFANLGLRIPLNRAARLPPGPPRTAAHRAVLVEPGDSGRMRVTIELPNATSVAIGGEWNAWNPVPMTRIAENRWQVLIPIRRGAWQFAVEVDGGTWVVPPGVPKLPDGFGGDVGILVIGG